VPKGQWEQHVPWGSNLGVMRMVILPQSAAGDYSLTSQYLNLAKNSSLAVAMAFRFISLPPTFNQTGRVVEVMLLIMVISNN